MLGRRRSGHSLVATLARLSFIQQTLFKSSVHCVTGTGIVLGGMMVNKTVLVIVEFRRVVEVGKEYTGPKNCFSAFWSFRPKKSFLPFVGKDTKIWLRPLLELSRIFKRNILWPHWGSSQGF